MNLAQGSSMTVQEIANMPMLWVMAIAVFAVIAVQSVIYLAAVRRNAAAADMTRQEVNQAFRSGGIAAIGPSMAVVLVSISLLPLFGTPPVLVRIGLIGSAGTELASAGAAANTMGAQLGGDTFTPEVFLVALFAMSLSGGMWMLAALFLTPVLTKSSDKLASVNPALMAIVPSAALLAAFCSLTIQEIPKSSVHVVTLLTSAAVMSICLFIAKRFGQGWLREWGLGFALVAGIVVAYFAHTAGMGA